MSFAGRMANIKDVTVTKRILLQIATAAGIVILVASGVTYRLVYRAAEQQAIAHLSDYVAERSRLEEANLQRGANYGWVAGNKNAQVLTPSANFTNSDPTANLAY
jgi:hypothetical protein